MATIRELLDTLPHEGRIDWIGVRPARAVDMQVVDAVQAVAGKGLTGDRFQARRNTREVTLIQGEHLAVVQQLLGLAELDPATLRRNLVVTGINLLALRERTFQVGETTLRMTGLAHPCSKMEARLGPGGYNALRGHGGITAAIETGGIIRLGDPVTLAG